MIPQNEHLAFPANPIHLASLLTGKTVRYKNAKRSTVTNDGVRVFKIKDVEDVFASIQTEKELAQKYGIQIAFEPFGDKGMQQTTEKVEDDE